MNIIKELAVFNRVTFVEGTHSYLVDNRPTGSFSVTQLLKKFKKPFEKEKIAARVAKRENIPVDVLLHQWQSKNLYSTTIGSILHKYIENYYCNKRTKIDISYQDLATEYKQQILSNLPLLIKQFHNFYHDHTNLLCVKNEVVLGDVDDTKVCGMSDMLCYNVQTDSLEILDFKTNKKMKETSSYGTLLFPFDDMTEGELNEYTIQLNTYKFFIEKYTNLKIDKLKIVWFNSTNENYKVFELLNIQEKIKQMFDVLKTNDAFENKKRKYSDYVNN